MHEYDIALKLVLRRLTGTFLRELTGFTVSRWHNVELPAVQNRHADMLGETADGTLLHVELQSTNQSGMSLRMLEYAVAIYHRFGRFPEQVVLYVGKPAMRMKCELWGPHLKFYCRMADIRELDGERLLSSGHLEDNVIAVLARLGDERLAVRRILRRIARVGRQRGKAAFDELVLLAGLRNLEPVIAQEVKEMPITADIMDHAIIGPARRVGIAIGIEQGMEEGARGVIMRMIAHRFGPIPPSSKKRFDRLPVEKLEKVAFRLQDASSMDDLLKPTRRNTASRAR